VVLLGLLCVIGTGVLGLQRVEGNSTELVSVGVVKCDLVSRMQLAIVSRVDTVRNIALTPEADAADAKVAPFMKQALGLARTLQPEMAAEMAAEMLTGKLGPVQQQWMAGLEALAAAAEAGRADVLAARLEESAAAAEGTREQSARLAQAVSAFRLHGA
jgi:hypothetical protein